MANLGFEKCGKRLRILLQDRCEINFLQRNAKQKSILEANNLAILSKLTTFWYGILTAIQI